MKNQSVGELLILCQEILKGKVNPDNTSIIRNGHTCLDISEMRIVTVVEEFVTKEELKRLENTVLNYGFSFTYY